MSPSLRCSLEIEPFEDRFLPSTLSLFAIPAPMPTDPSGMMGHYSVPSAADVEPVAPLSGISPSTSFVISGPGQRPTILPGASSLANPGLGSDSLRVVYLDTEVFPNVIVPPPIPGDGPAPQEVPFPTSLLGIPTVNFPALENADRVSLGARMPLPTVAGLPNFLTTTVTESIGATQADGAGPLGRVVVPTTGATGAPGSRMGDAVGPAGLMAFPESGDTSPESGAPRPSEPEILPSPEVLLPQSPIPELAATLTATLGWVVPGLPSGILVSGAFGANAAALERGVEQLLTHLSDLTVDSPDGADGSEVGMWLAAAATLTAGAGYTAWAHRGPARRPVTFGSVARLREVEDDSQTR